MTRKEEIEKAWMSKCLQSNHRYDEQTFREAVEWADKTMIDKACDYLYKLNQMNFNEYGRHCPLVHVHAFREAMEEQL